MNLAGNTHMESGRTYRVQYQGPSGRTTYELIGKFLSFARQLDTHYFDLRPTAGTVPLRRKEITFIEEVPTQTPVAPKRLPRA